MPMIVALSFKPLLRCVAGAAVLALVAGCATPQKVSVAELDSFGVRTGSPHWEATSRLAREGYACFVSGAKRENFDCTKSSGLFISCISRIRFTVDDENKIAAISVPQPACMGTP
jgi:hypothetical protein